MNKHANKTNQTKVERTKIPLKKSRGSYISYWSYENNRKQNQA